MLDKEAANIDAVIVTIPDHMHTAAALAAMERGKHVYVQKPLAHTVWECRELMKAAEKYKVATQMGNQGYSNEGTRQCAEMIWSGAIGNVTEVHAWTNRPAWPQGITEAPATSPVPGTLDWDLWLGIAKERPYSEDYLPFSWRGFFDFGSGASGGHGLPHSGRRRTWRCAWARRPASNACIRKTAATSISPASRWFVSISRSARVCRRSRSSGTTPCASRSADVPGAPQGEILGDLPRNRAPQMQIAVLPEGTPDPGRRLHRRVLHSPRSAAAGSPAGLKYCPWTPMPKKKRSG